MEKETTTKKVYFHLNIKGENVKKNGEEKGKTEKSE